MPGRACAVRVHGDFLTQEVGAHCPAGAQASVPISLDRAAGGAGLHAPGLPVQTCGWLNGEPQGHEGWRMEACPAFFSSRTARPQFVPSCQRGALEYFWWMEAPNLGKGCWDGGLAAAAFHCRGSGHHLHSNRYPSQGFDLLKAQCRSQPTAARPGIRIVGFMSPCDSPPPSSQFVLGAQAGEQGTRGAELVCPGRPSGSTQV